MLTDAYEPAMEFYKVTEEEYIPAVISGDQLKAQQLLTGKLQPLYDRHKAAIDQIAGLVNEDNARIEKNTITKDSISL